MEQKHKIMTEKLKQIIKEEIIKLPKDVQNAISISSWEQTTEEIGKRFLLSENEINDFQAETLIVLIGLEDSDFYAGNIENNIGTSKNEAEKIAEEVTQKIFNPIYDALAKKIKENLKNTKPNWKQNLDFTLSGGDYSIFMEKRDDTINTTPNIPLVKGNTTSPLHDKGEVGRGF